jgi:predicted acetyltransferase
MAVVEIKQVSGEEYVDIAVRVAGYAFGPSPPGANRAEWEEEAKAFDNATHFAVLEDGKAVTIVSSTPMRQNVRGALFPAGGVWGVASDPQVRRKGYVRRALTRLFEAMRDDGMPLSVLYPFRESFYDRLGYATFPQSRMVTIAASALVPLLTWNLPGSVELLQIADGYDRFRAYLERQQRRIHGMGLFVPGSASLVQKQNKFWLLVATVDGEEVGMMTYRIVDQNQGRNLVTRSFYPADSRGRYLLLEWMARHSDQVRDIEIRLPPSVQPETWLPDLNVTFSSGYQAMGRIIDIRRLDGMPVGSGQFAARITDAYCRWNEGAYAFTATDSGLHITPADTVDCDLTIQGLTALVYGTHDPGDFELRGWGNPSTAVQATMRKLFSAQSPYIHEVF